VAPPSGAGPLKVKVIVAVCPETSVDGLMLTETIVTAVV
jgi:hypothetical protein